MKLAKALKEKNRLVGEIVRLKSIIERENSRIEKSTSKVDRDDLWERLALATESLIGIKAAIFTANAKVYDKLFTEYRVLHDYFGRGANDVMKRLKAIKAQA